MTARSFFVDFENPLPGIGAVIITDESLLLRPALFDQSPGAHYDTENAYRLLSLGNDLTDAAECHIFSMADPVRIRAMLSDVIATYMRTCAEQGVGGGARVTYLVDDEELFVDEYGTSEDYVMTFRVYCAIRYREAPLRKILQGSTAAIDYFVVIRPDDSALGYTADGLLVESQVEDHLYAIALYERAKRKERRKGITRVLMGASETLLLAIVLLIGALQRSINLPVAVVMGVEGVWMTWSFSVFMGRLIQTVVLNRCHYSGTKAFAKTWPAGFTWIHTDQGACVAYHCSDCGYGGKDLITPGMDAPVHP